MLRYLAFVLMNFDIGKIILFYFILQRNNLWANSSISEESNTRIILSYYKTGTVV